MMFSDDTPFTQLNTTCSTQAVVNFWGKGTPFRVVIGLTCFLSIIGALLIIASYAFFKNIRSDARLILVHLSLMDFGVGLTNLIGNLIYFDRFYFTDHCRFQHPKHEYINSLCIAQGFFAHYFTMGSILWTISLAMYIYFLIVQHRTPVAKYTLRISYVVCYAFPALICLWLVLTNRFGYSPYNSGWCSILIISPETNKPDVFAAVLGYDLWIYLTMIFIPVLYLAVELYLRQKLKQTRQYLRNAEERFWGSVYILDYKFLLIPIVFAILRIWTCMITIFVVYLQAKGFPLWLNITMLYLAGIGDSGQGFANAILFVLFTKRVRTTVFNLTYWKDKFLRREESEPLFHESRPFTSGSDSGDPVPPMESDIFTPPRVSSSVTFTNSLTSGTQRKMIGTINAVAT